MNKLELAAELREIARLVEVTEARGTPNTPGCHQAANEIFTCSLIGARIGQGVRRDYEYVFGLRGENDSDLWDQPNVHSIRILMLGFAAAMAETGDFH